MAKARRQKRRGNPGGKGPEWERTVCRRLSMWVTDLERKDIFWRSKMSGGSSTIAKRAGQHGHDEIHSGDVCAVHPIGHFFLEQFTVEAHWYRDLDLTQAVFRNEGALFVKWRQANEACPEGREPFLASKMNYQGELLGTTTEGMRRLFLGVRRKSEVPILAIFPEEDLNICKFRDILTYCSWERFQRRRLKELPPKVRTKIRRREREHKKMED